MDLSSHSMSLAEDHLEGCLLQIGTKVSVAEVVSSRPSQTLDSLESLLGFVCF